MNETLVSFPRLGLRLLGAPAQFPHHPPDMAGMIANPGLAGDDRGDPGQAPEIGVQAVGAGSFEKSGFDLFQLGRGNSRLSSGAAGGGQRFLAAPLPNGEPDADRLAGNVKLPRHFGLGDSLLEKLGGGESSLFHPGKITSGAVGLKGLSFHASIITWKSELST